ncbi:MAG TPA: cellulase family glycosylhydrolase [Candidatus Binatia bacterium]|nr:cellulase family glycosylhydrolase [Candidatus Binatia bacterium]
MPVLPRPRTLMPCGIVAMLLAAALGPYQPAAAERTAKPLRSSTVISGHEGRWLTDARGRVVTLHGVNMVAKLPPYDPAALGFSEDDARFLASEGLNTVRLGIIYKALEPVRGQYGDAYLESIAGTARMLGRAGIHVLVDFHQDLFNERFSGEGFPDWAVQDDGLPAQPDAGFPGNYFVMPALWRAYDHFWANDPAPDGTPLQDAYADAWHHAASRLRKERAIFGYDIFNETWPGSQYPSCVNPDGCPLFDATATEFHEKVFARIRQADAGKLVFYETHPVFGAGADVHIGDTGDENAGFSFHVYCLGAAAGVPEQYLGMLACPLGIDRPFERAQAQSDRTGDALLMSEFGATDDLDALRRDVEAAERHRMSWQYWSYWNRDPCCDRPHEGVIIDPALPPSADNVKQAKLDVLVRPYPRATAGTPVSYAFHSQSADRLFELVYESDPAIRAASEVFVPARHYPGGYSAVVTGPARIVSRPNAPVLKLRGTAAGQVRVEIRRVAQ